jgi:hypothetical protein
MDQLTKAALGALPAGLQAFVNGDRYNNKRELIQNCALEFLKAKSTDTLEQIYKRARARTRRYTQDIVHFSCAYDDSNRKHEKALEFHRNLFVMDEGEEEAAVLKRSERTKALAETLGVSQRRAQQIVKQQLDDTKRQGDFFVMGDAS